MNRGLKIVMALVSALFIFGLGVWAVFIVVRQSRLRTASEPVIFESSDGYTAYARQVFAETKEVNSLLIFFQENNSLYILAADKGVWSDGVWLLFGVFVNCANREIFYLEKDVRVRVFLPTSFDEFMASPSEFIRKKLSPDERIDLLRKLEELQPEE